MKNILLSFGLWAFVLVVSVAQQTVSSPDGRLTVTTGLDDGMPYYAVQYDGLSVIERSPLGLEADYGDLSRGLTLVTARLDTVQSHYTLDRSKRSEVDYLAHRLVTTYEGAKGRRLSVEFQVSDDNIAFRYRLPRVGETGSVRVMREATGFTLPAGARSYLCPQSDPMVGWKRTKPSYEEEYALDAPATQRSAFGRGFTFPCLFKVRNELQSEHNRKLASSLVTWVQVSETGVDSHYCGSHLSDPVARDEATTYSIAFPMPEENNGNGTVEPAFALPGATPWRTITVGHTLAPIVESTVTWDVVEPLYAPSRDYQYGKGSWSWILWQDPSICYDDQVKYIDLAAHMGFQYCLVDDWWDVNIGRQTPPTAVQGADIDHLDADATWSTRYVNRTPAPGRSIEDLQRYAQSRGIDLFLWYSSSGYWNDIVQGPVSCMDNPIVRKREMKWMQQMGVRGIKVDFFGGDKQETLRLYEEILSDANEYGLMVIFHGCTLPRGWERMYPNYVGSEAVLASENMYFSEHFCDQEAVNACTHPFVRNAVGCMEFGGCFLNHRMSRDNRSRHPRHTTDVFQLATCVLFQNPIQNFALAPNNWSDFADGALDGNEGSPAPKVCLDFVRDVPTTWDETRLLAGQPGHYVALARRKGTRWYIAAVNAETEPLHLTLDLATLSGLDASSLVMLSGGNAPKVTTPRLRGGKLSLTIAKDDGVVIY